MFDLKQFMTSGVAFVLCAGAAAAQNVIVIPDSVDQPFIVTPNQTSEGVGDRNIVGDLLADIESTDLQSQLLAAPDLISARKFGIVVVHAEKGKKASKPIPGCKSPLSARIGTGSPRSQVTAQCGVAIAACTVPLNNNNCKGVSRNKDSADSGECTVLAGSADGARGFCMYTKP